MITEKCTALMMGTQTTDKNGYNSVTRIGIGKLEGSKESYGRQEEEEVLIVEIDPRGTE